MRTLALALTLAFASSARGYEPQTHAGIAEKAAVASGLHQILVDKLGRSLGLFEPLRIVRKSEERGELERRLAQLDPEGGFAPEDGKQSALGWLMAGAVLEGIPAERQRHHFYDPTRELGLAEGEGLAFRTRVTDVATGIGSFRGIFTGKTFDGTGRPTPAWVLGPRDDNENAWGLARFLDERERAASAKTIAERDDALARALLTAGAIVGALSEMGHPAHVRNDYRVALERGGDAYGRFVARRYGRSGVPVPRDEKLSPGHLGDLFRELARETARRFFSPGTLPSSGRYASPRVSAAAAGGHASGAVKHLVAYRKSGATTTWWLDDACHHDYAESLLPEIGRHATAALALLFRGRIELDGDGGRLSGRLHDVTTATGTFRLYADDAKGERKLLLEKKLTRIEDEGALGHVERPEWARRAAAVFRGSDSRGEPIVVVSELPLR
jgi:hypothetical protein